MKPNKSSFQFNERREHDQIISRRKVLKLSALTVLMGISPQTVFGSPAEVSPPERSLAFYNTHTGERLKTVYWVEGNYLSESLGEINYILRDHRTDTIKEIDARLLDLLFAIRNALSTNQSFHIISGYRSAETNGFLRSQSSAVAVNSLHLHGKAIDVRVPGRALPVLRNVAMTLKGGGVGYYPKSDFVHVDIGRVRYW